MECEGLQPGGVIVFNANTLPREVDALLDEFGELSANAQGIRQPITSAAKLRASGHRVYIIGDYEGRFAGFLKVGTKHLYYYDRKGKVSEIDPVCALDFYVHESCQRQGLGRALTNFFLESEDLEMRRVAWDKPTDKSLALLQKHYGLTDFNPQPNNFVVFDDHFS